MADQARDAQRAAPAVLTPADVRLIDSKAADLGVLVKRAGAAVARHAISMLGGAYGRRVVVVAGPGNNGADGRVAAELLGRRGVRVEVVSPSVASVGRCDLVIDAAFGTGLSRRYDGPEIDPGTPVLAVDVPSGLDALTGGDFGAVPAASTLTFDAPRQGMFFADGPRLCGQVVVADIGVDLGPADPSTWHMTDAVASMLLPDRGPLVHKWSNAVRIIGGSELMPGAARLAASAALRGGSGMVVVSRIDGTAPSGLPVEAIGRVIRPDGGVVDELGSDAHRYRAAIVGPGCGTSGEVLDRLREIASELAVPTVVDADAITALTRLASTPDWPAPRILTPHDGEFERLTGSAPGNDRVSAARELAVAQMAVIVLKGPASVVAGPGGEAWIVDSGDERLATAGSGDVLAGIIAAAIDGSEPGPALTARVAAAVHWHGVAGSSCGRHGVVASDVVSAMGRARERIDGAAHTSAP